MKTLKKIGLKKPKTHKTLTKGLLKSLLAHNKEIEKPPLSSGRGGKHYYTSSHYQYF